MCEPMMMGMIGMIGSMASSFMSYQSQMNVMKEQDAANAQWVEWQRGKSQQEWQRQEQMRQRASTARDEGLEKLKAPEQQKAQEDESQRLAKDITPQDMLDENPQLIGDKLLSGQQNTAAPVKAGIADSITQASRDARSRIQALATLQSYGGSQGGIANRVNDIFRQSGQEIGFQGNLRQGSLSAYGSEKQVQPRHIVATPSPWGGIAGSLAGIAGRGFAAGQL